MNTFLPYSDFERSAECLDNKRLGKQRVEAWQIYRALKGETKGWRNHPATLMWKGYESALLRYCLIVISEWNIRKFKDNMYEKVFQAMQIEDMKYPPNTKVPYPEFIGNEQFHAAMRSNLLRKDKKFYLQYGWTEPDNLPYVWGNKK